MSYKELGGFAENQDALDGQESFKSFNYCIAQQYLDAILAEDFILLGNLSNNVIEDVAFWLNYDGRLNNDKENIIEKLLNATLITKKNRTFKDAIIENRQAKSAYVWLNLGCKNDIDLMVCHILNINDIEEYNKCFYTNSSLFQCNTKKELTDGLKEIISKIKNIYDNETNDNNKVNILNSLKSFLQKFRYDSSYGKIYIDDYDKDNFIKNFIFKK